MKSLIREIHQSSSQIVLAVTGGGSKAVSDLLTVPGASKTVISAVVPYSSQALTRWLGATPEQFCSEKTARLMAMVAFEEARQLCSEPFDLDQETNHLLGVACTASLASDSPKRGPHRAHISIQSDGFTLTGSLMLEKGRRDRLEEEQLVSILILNQIAQVSGIDTQIECELSSQEQLITKRTDAEPQWRLLMLGDRQATRISNETPEKTQTSVKALFPGAFNPLHSGHLKMVEIAEKMLGRGVEFEMSIDNVDKPTLDYMEIARRVASFPKDNAVWLTRAATFLEKSQLFPGVTFIVGADTIQRIADPRYYDDDLEACHDAISRIISADCQFLVFGRNAKGTFQTIDDLNLLRELREICRQVPETDFRDDISSTKIRAEKGSLD